MGKLCFKKKVTFLLQPCIHEIKKNKQTYYRPSLNFKKKISNFVPTLQWYNFSIILLQTSMPTRKLSNCRIATQLLIFIGSYITNWKTIKSAHTVHKKKKNRYVWKKKRECWKQCSSITFSFMGEFHTPPLRSRTPP